MNKDHPVIFSCLKCKSIPQIELSSLSSLSIKCDCGYSRTIDINEYLTQIKAINTPKEKDFCVQCQQWIDKDSPHQLDHLKVNTKIKMNIYCDKHPSPFLYKICSRCL